MKTEHTIEYVKKLAKRIKKKLGVPHHLALNMAAVEIGFVSWDDFLDERKAKETE